MSALIKTWPAFMSRRKTLEIFNHDWGQFYFTLGRGRPKQEIHELWYTHRGRILGHFMIDKIVRNLGNNLPKLHSLTGEVSEWQIKLMNWVAVCNGPFVPLEEKLYYEPHRGWHYFDLEKHRGTLDAKVRL